MSTELGLAIRRKSATPSGHEHPPGQLEVSKIVDIDLCIGCKACEVACKEWNDLDAEETSNFGSYQSHEDLTTATWDLMRFNEVDLPDGDLAWLIRKDSCLHCDEPGASSPVRRRAPSSSTRTASSTSTGEVHRLPVQHRRLPVRHSEVRRKPRRSTSARCAWTGSRTGSSPPV